MKHFTLISLSVLALCFASAQADAQTARMHRLNVQMPLRNAPKTVRALLTQASDKVDATYRPHVQKIYSYDDGNWAQESTYTFQYDQAGRVVCLDIDEEDGIQRTESTYDANGMLLTEVNSVSVDGGKTFTPDSKRVQTYDKVLPQLTLTKDRYTWNADDNEWIATYDAFRREITRDADGNVTSLTLSVPYMGEFDATQRITNTFDPVTKQALTFKLEEQDENGEWNTSQYLRDLVWEQTNGQLVDQFDNWREYGNLVKSATISEVDETTGETVDFGKVNVTYSHSADNQLNFREEINYTDELSRSVTELNYNDQYGSYTNNYYDLEDVNGDGVLTDDEKTYEESAVVSVDEHGNVVKEEGYMLNDEGTTEQSYGTKYEYTYDPAHSDAAKEIVISEYDYDAGKYAPTMKIVTESFTSDVTSVGGIKAGMVDDSNVVYNMQGMKTNGMEKGISIVKRNGKTIKILKK